MAGGIRENKRKYPLTVDTHTDDVGEDRGGDLVTIGKQTEKKYFSKLEAQCSEQLLPGLLDDITLDLIVPKLPRGAINVLWSVSRWWRKAIRNRQVYDARVRSHSTETFVVLNYSLSSESTSVALYSMRDKSCVPLPPIPGLDIGIPWLGQCVALDGKVYILGGQRSRELRLASAEVHVLDLAGRRQWKKCASMREGRHAFACGVKNGKIYVLGGTWDGRHASDGGRTSDGAEVYDPTEDAWSPIMPMQFRQIRHKVATGKDNLVVYDGVFHPEPSERNPNCFENIPDSKLKWAKFLQIYNPTKNEWKLKGPFDDTPFNIAFMAMGKFYRITPHGIDVHHMGRNAWTTLHLHSFAFSQASATLRPKAVLAVNDELLLVVSPDVRDQRSSLLRSKGLGNKNKEILWEKADCTLSFPSCPPPFMCPIQL